MRGRRATPARSESTGFTSHGFDLQARLDEAIPAITETEALAAVAYTAAVAERQGWDPATVLAMLGIDGSAA